MALGRISGPLLRDNLYRDGVDIAFETDLLYIDVVRGRIGIKASTAAGNLTHELTVTGTTRTTDLIVDTQAEIASFTLSSNIIASSNGTISLEPSGANPVVYQAKLVLDDLQISNNTIEVTTSNTDLVFQTQGTGEVNINSSVTVNGNLHATGNITADGDITFGEGSQTPGVDDTVTFIAEIASSIIPDQDSLYDLGSDPNTGGKAWRTAYVSTLETTNINSSTIVVDGINLILPQGNIFYVAKNGSDTNAGEHEHNPFLTVKHALDQAASGDTVYIYPGEYLEEFPLTVPAGVTVKGAGLRSVNIKPTIATNDLDAFILNGETTVEDLTVSDFFYNAVNNTGYGFRFADNFTVTTRSPYIRNITVITRGSVTSGSDPYGFDQNDAGKGALLDGSVADISSREAAMLFHSCTFFTPNQETITATNGVRIEWLNSFTYFADKGLYAYSSADGFAGAGATRLRIDSRTGTWAVGNTVTYYDTDGSTVLASGTIASIDGDYFNITGRQLGFESIIDRAGKTVFAQGNAKLSTAEKKFGSASLSLDGTGDYVTHPSIADFGFGTGDFTIEGWFYKTAALSQILVDTRTTSNQNSIMVQSNGGGNLRLFVNGVFVLTSSNNHTLNTWNHLAISRASGVTRFFINGVVSTNTYVDATDYGTTKPLVLGASFVGLTSFSGYIDDFKISKGVARYTTTFTPSAIALTGDLSTVLLLHFNGTNNSITFLDDGITFQDLRTSAGGTATLIDFADYSDFGAEIRAIGSANVYGTYGAYGDGVGVIAYLISQNFAYVGAGKLTTNDPNDRIGANEITELNGARIYFTSVDNEGNFTVGDLFTVNQRTGDVTFNGESFSVTTAAGITFTDGVNTTTVLPTEITTGNIKISGNTIESITGAVNVVAANGTINLQNNTYITGDLDVTGDITLGGNITIGDNSTDTISFVGEIISNLVPGTTASYDLGTDLLRWQNAFLSRVEIDGLLLDNNTISTTINDDDLILTANGTGRIYIPTNNVQIDQQLTVNGDTNLKATTINGNITQTGDVNQTGDYTQTGDTTITGNLTVSTFAQFEQIRIDGNEISTTAVDTDLQLEADGTGIISIPTNDVQISQDLTVDGTLTAGTVNATTIIANAFDTGDILIENNTITTTVTDSDLELSADGTGIISIPTNDVQISQDLTVDGTFTVTTGTTYLKNVSVTGDITQTGDINQTGNFTTSGNTEVTGNIVGTGYLRLPNIEISSSTVTTRTSGTDLQLQANGTGNVVFEGLKVSDNNIQSTVTNSNITLTPQGTGTVVINSNQSLIIPVGGSSDRPTGANGMIRYNTTLSRYEGWNGSYWLTLGGVQDADGNTKIIAESAPGSNDNTLYFYADGNLTATIDSTKLYTTKFQTNNIDITDNTISSIDTNSDINITTAGTGSVKIGNLKIRNNTITNTVSGAVTDFTQSGSGYVKIAGTNGVVIPAGDLAQLPTVAELGMIRFNTFYGYVEIFNGVSWVNVAGATSGITISQATDIGIISALFLG
jgi:hypothetical protein